MKALLAVAALAVGMSIFAEAKGGGGRGGNFHSVRGYSTSKGTWVAPHHATNPNGTKLDNWSTKGNVNPLTGKFGTKTP